jgi:hypothetical protein
MTREEYRDWRARTAEAARDDGRNGSPFQLCSRCGGCEYAGGFCSWCQTADYSLTAHRHVNQAERCATGRLPMVTSEGVWHHPARTIGRVVGVTAAA